jgi:hypothetical protein
MKSNVTEAGIVLVLTGLLILLINPLGIFMPTMMEMLVVALASLVFLLFVGFVWKEQVLDEREELHRFLAARFAYVVGAVILMGAILVQSLVHDLDPWIVGALIGMLVAKVIGRRYAQIHY